MPQNPTAEIENEIAQARSLRGIMTAKELHLVPSHHAFVCKSARRHRGRRRRAESVLQRTQARTFSFCLIPCFSLFFAPRAVQKRNENTETTPKNGKIMRQNPTTEIENE